MATATYKRGEKVPATYTAGADVVVDEVLVCGAAAGVSVGVSTQNIANGESGIVDIGGIFLMPKVSGAVIKAGESVDWDAGAGEVDDNQAAGSAGDVADFGVATEDKGNGETMVEVMLVPGNGVLA